MKLYITLIFFVFFSKIYSQEVIIYGKIKTFQGKGIKDASIFMGDEIVAISDDYGMFYFHTNTSGNIYLTAKSFGFEPKTKFIEISDSISKYYVDFILDLHPFELDTVTIQAKALSLYDKEDWSILNFIIDDNNVFVLNIDGTKPYLSIYDTEGQLLNRKLLKYKFNNIIKSCLGGYHLVGNKYCQEFTLRDNKIILNATYSKNLYDDYLKSCVSRYDSVYIFKRYSNFNKKITYYYFDEKKQIKNIFSIYDKEAFGNAISEYNAILNLYNFMTSKKDDNSDVSSFNNILSSGDWKGDLDELGISPELMFKIMWFKRVLSNRINSELIIMGDDLYILDFVTNAMYKIDLLNDSNPKPVLSLPECKNPKVNFDPVYNKNYLICNNEKIFVISKHGSEFDINEKYKIPLRYRFPQNTTIYNEHVFFIHYDNIASTYNKFTKISMGIK